MIFQDDAMKEHWGVEVARIKANQIQEEQVDDFWVRSLGRFFVKRGHHVAHYHVFLAGIRQFLLIAISQAVEWLEVVVCYRIISELRAPSVVFKDLDPCFEAVEGADSELYVIIQSLIVSHGHVS